MIARLVGHGVEHAPQCVELPLHASAIARDPRVDLGERFGTEAIVTEATMSAFFD